MPCEPQARQPSTAPGASFLGHPTRNQSPEVGKNSPPSCPQGSESLDLSPPRPDALPGGNGVHSTSPSCQLVAYWSQDLVEGRGWGIQGERPVFHWGQARGVNTRGDSEWSGPNPQAVAPPPTPPPRMALLGTAALGRISAIPGADGAHGKATAGAEPGPYLSPGVPQQAGGNPCLLSSTRERTRMPAVPVTSLQGRP